MPNNNIALVKFDVDDKPDRVTFECETILEEPQFTPAYSITPELKEVDIVCHYDVYLSTCEGQVIAVPWDSGKARLTCGVFNGYYNGADEVVHIDKDSNGRALLETAMKQIYEGCRLVVDDSHIELQCLNRDGMCFGEKPAYETLLMEGF